MTGPAPEVAAVRLAVRRCMAVIEDPRAATVLVACSGGADSMALLAATVFESARTERRVIGCVVDHGLQAGSAEHTESVVSRMAALGVDETAAIRVTVEPGGLGVEAAARQARYAALAQLAEHFESGTVLLGHTRDDQAETVLLGLTRGSGGRSLAGMRSAFSPDGPEFPPLFRRPLLEITRAQTEAACAAEAIPIWQDPHNQDPRFTRSRIRHTVMPVLERELGPGVADALARTAMMLREDVDALDDLAEAALAQSTAQSTAQSSAQVGAGATSSALDLAALRPQPPAVRRRVLRLAALRVGAPAAELTRGHVLEVDRLVTDWRGQRWVDLPGPVRVTREGGSLLFQQP